MTIRIGKTAAGLDAAPVPTNEGARRVGATNDAHSEPAADTPHAPSAPHAHAVRNSIDDVPRLRAMLHGAVGDATDHAPATTAIRSAAPAITGANLTPTDESIPSPIPHAGRAVDFALAMNDASFRQTRPNPNTDDGSWSGYCLAFVRRAFLEAGVGWPAEVAEAAQGNNTARLVYEWYAAPGRGYVHRDGLHDATYPPAGALVFFGYVDGEGNDLGHVGISLGDGTFVGTDWAADGSRVFTLAEYDRITREDGGYLGWAYPDPGRQDPRLTAAAGRTAAANAGGLPRGLTAAEG